MPSVISDGLSIERRQLRARKGVAVRCGNTAEAARLDTEIRTARLADYIRQTVDASPPLTVEQREELARLLVPSLRAGGLDGAA